MSAKSLKQYVLPMGGWFVRDQVDDVYKLLIRKLAAFENASKISNDEEKRITELFMKFIATKRKGDERSIFAMRMSELLEDGQSSELIYE